MANFKDSKYFFSKGIPTETDLFANVFQWYIDIYHLPSGRNVAFKALLNDIGDSYKQNWNSESLYGRMDQLHTFINTTRTMSLSFRVAAASLEEAIYNLNKQNLLTAFQYPSYSFIPSQGYGNANTLSAGPLVKIKFANILCDANNPNGSEAKTSGLLGKMSGIQFKPLLDFGMFNTNGQMFPKIHDLSFDFEVLHQHGLGWGADGLPGVRSNEEWPYTIDRPLLNSIGENTTDQQKRERNEKNQNLTRTDEADADSDTMYSNDDGTDSGLPDINNTVKKRRRRKDIIKIINQSPDVGWA